nr:hypothetical protein BaRGS_029269 [Batillaria attramentaria]
MAFEESEIYQAILDGDLPALGYSVQENDVNLRSSEGKSFLHVAVELGQEELTDFLVQRVFLGFRDSNGDTALDLADRLGLWRVVRTMLQKVSSLQESGDMEALQALFQCGWQAWVPPHTTASTQASHVMQQMLRYSKQVEAVHTATQEGNLSALQDALTEESLALACDHTGLPPLQKAVLFECLSVAQYLSLGFPRAVNQPDHMGRTALHYAAGHHEYQDNILYKLLLRAGAREDVTDLAGYKPTDYTRDPYLFSVDHMKHEVVARLHRPRPNYMKLVQHQANDPGSGGQSKASSRNTSLHRWRAIASVASFTHNPHLASRRRVPFEDTGLYEAIITNDFHGVRFLLELGEDPTQRNIEGWNYLHLAVAHFVSPHMLSLLLNYVSPAERDVDGLTPLELALTVYRNRTLADVQLNLILGLVLKEDVVALQKLASDGWQYWPSIQHGLDFLQPMLTPHMLQLLAELNDFKTEIQELHKAAILHQTISGNAANMLETEIGVTSLDNAGLSLVHVCVIFYNIKLLALLLHRFPFTANVRDNLGRTPLHYAAGLQDDEYMYNWLRVAGADDGVEDVWGMRPVDYLGPEGNSLVSPSIQEGIRDKLHSSPLLVPPWPTCLLSAKMESSKLYDAIKANDAEAVQTLLADADTDTSLRDSDGRTFLHNAVLTGADLPVLKALLDRVDISVRDAKGNTVLDLIFSGSYPESGAEAIEAKVRELILGGGEEEVQRLLLSGWTLWPVTVEEAKEKSEELADQLEKLLEAKDKVTEIHKAVQEGRVKDVKGLLDRKHLALAADHTGLPPLQKAVIFQQPELVQYLVEDFPDTVGVKDNLGRTALHYAAGVSDEGAMYKTLQDAGADETVADLMGKTAKDYNEQPGELNVADVKTKVEEMLSREILTSKPTEASTAMSEEHTDAGNLPDTSATTPATEADTTEPKQPTLPPPEPPKPEKVQPVSLYVPEVKRERVPPPTTVDGKYVAEHLGTALTLALAEIAERRPWDPIEYLGHWLYKYRKNLDEMEEKKRMLGDIRSEEEEMNMENENKFIRKEEEMRFMEEDRRKKEEEEAERKKKEQEELQRQAKEAILAQKPQLPTVTEEAEEDNMVRDRDENGQTELHLLAAQSGADLVAVINMGYSLADRDENNRTPRDVAEELGITENVDAIDNYVTNLLEQEKLETLTQLIVDGYDKLDAVLDKVSTDGLPKDVTDFVNSIPKLQERVSAVFKAVSSGVARDVENALERKTLVLAKDKYGRSPLHIAILAGHDEIAQNIVKNFPSSVKARDNLNRTPLHYAIALSDEMADFLKANGADVNAKDARQHSPAYYRDEKDEIEKLKETLPSPDTATNGENAAAPASLEEEKQPDDADKGKEETTAEGAPTGETTATEQPAADSS